MKKDLWFANKTYGYGWTPTTSQGWMLIVLFILLQVLIGYMAFTLEGVEAQLTAYAGATVLNVYILLRITIAHAPKARWQWGDGAKKKK